MSLPKIAVLVLSLLLASCSSLFVLGIRADDVEVRYLVDLSRPWTQTVDVTVVLPAAGLEEETVMLPTWRPGRYTILDPVATVQNVRATSGSGEPLAIRKIDKSSWRVTTGGAEEVRVSYRVYANSLRDRTRHVDPTHAFLSGSSVFFYSPRLRAAPVRVEIFTPEGWDVATGLEKAPGLANVVVAANYDVLVDSPLEIGEHDRISFDVDGLPHEIVIWPAGVEHGAERMIADFGAIVREHAAIFGRTPYERYVFLIHAGPGGGGTEHLNSTIMQTSREAIEASVDGDGAWKRFLGLVSHEFFHTWNVKQLRPAGIHPYDYQHENYTDLLWVAEGTTSYYAPLTLVRADLAKVAGYLDEIGSAGDALRRNPGARVQSVAEASWDSWISSFNANSANTTVDFYGKGALVSLCLDMEVRKRTRNAVSLDAVLRTMFERFPLSGRGYTTDDLIATLDELSASSFAEFFARYVSGTERLPFEETLGVVGLEFAFEPRKKKGDEKGEEEEEKDDGDTEEETETEDGTTPAEIPTKAYLGLRLSGGGSGATVRTLLADGPAWDSGLLVGDEIVALNGKRLRAGDLDERLEKLAPGDTVTFHYLREDDLRTLDVVLAGVPDGKWKVRRLEAPTDEQKSAYASWIGHPWPGDEKAEEAEPAEATTPAE